jgi:hypothetical protein
MEIKCDWDYPKRGQEPYKLNTLLQIIFMKNSSNYIFKGPAVRLQTAYENTARFNVITLYEAPSCCSKFTLKNLG